MSTASTLPYDLDEEIQDEIRKNPSIDHSGESAKEVAVFYKHFIPAHRQRPPAPFAVISQTNLHDVVCQEQAQTNIDATLAQNSYEIQITNDAAVNLDEAKNVEESTHDSDDIQLVEVPKETEPTQFRVVKTIIVGKKSNYII